MRKNTLAWAGAMLLLAIGTGGAAPARTDAGNENGAWLGVYSQTLTPELREGMNLRAGTGVSVSRVVQGSPAEDAGLRTGDVILSVNGQSIGSPSQLSSVVRASGAGRNVSLRVAREGTTRTLTVRLAERPENDSEMSSPDVPEAPEASEAPEAPEAPESGEAPHTEIAPDVRDLPGGTFFDNGEDPMVRVMRMTGRGRLGVRVETLNEDLADYFHVPGGRGVLVLEVMKDTPAARAGLKAGDVIQRVNQKPVYAPDDLVNALTDQNGRVTLSVVRKGSTRTVQTELDRSTAMSPQARYRIDRNLSGNNGLMLRRPLVRGRALDSSDRMELRRELQDLRRHLDELERRLAEPNRN